MGSLLSLLGEIVPPPVFLEYTKCLFPILKSKEQNITSERFEQLRATNQHYEEYLRKENIEIVALMPIEQWLAAIQDMQNALGKTQQSAQDLYLRALHVYYSIAKAIVNAEGDSQQIRKILDF